VDAYKEAKKGGKRRGRYRLAAALKSCNRLFDIPCKKCDKKASDKARRLWQERVAAEVTFGPEHTAKWTGDPIGTLKARVRELVGSQWAKKIVRKGEAYVPDQQGCLENERMTGGTFGVHEKDYSDKPNIVRTGVAKTKGKFRVVTMQGAMVKRILTPLHDALYDHISSFGWCVRGDVQKSDFESILQDRLEGESLISGDYSLATDNIYLFAVEAIVDVLCESQHLTEEENNILRQSFTDLHWRSNRGELYQIKRGSMMGNLMSFPILCLLNKACYDMARDHERGKTVNGKKERKVRVNGDDIMFSGSQEFYSLWKHVVSYYGLIVNEEKTGIDDRFLELNSRQYDCGLRRFVGKPVLSFLRRLRSDESGDLLSEIIKGCSSLSNDVQMYIINDLMRYEISIRSISVSNIPGGLWRALLKRKWFRAALELGPLPVKEIGVKRSLPSLVAAPPRPEIYDWIDRVHRVMTVKMVREFRGQNISPVQSRIDRSGAAERRRVLVGYNSVFYYERSPLRWAFVWPKDVYEFLFDEMPGLLATEEELQAEWYEDHPFLTVRSDLVKSRAVRPGHISYQAVAPPPALLSDTVVGHVMMYPNQD
jgi:hypothetical protein